MSLNAVISPKLNQNGLNQFCEILHENSTCISDYLYILYRFSKIECYYTVFAFERNIAANFTSSKFILKLLSKVDLNRSLNLTKLFYFHFGLPPCVENIIWWKPFLSIFKLLEECSFQLHYNLIQLNYRSWWNSSIPSLSWKTLNFSL